MAPSASKDSLRNLYQISIYKRKLSFINRVILGILGGIYLSFGNFIGGSIATVYYDESPGTAKLLYCCLFPIGLILIVFGQADLFTSNCMIVFIGVYNDYIKKRKNKIINDKYHLCDVINVLYNSWLWNFIGSLIISYFIAYHGEYLQSNNYYVTMIHKKLLLSNKAVFLRSIGANWLVCLAVFLANGTKNNIEKVIFIFLPIATFVGIGFEHSVANMFSFPCAILSNIDKDITWYAFFSKNIFLCTLGNIFGGIICGLFYLILNNDMDIDMDELETSEDKKMISNNNNDDIENPIHHHD